MARGSAILVKGREQQPDSQETSSHTVGSESQEDMMDNMRGKRRRERKKERIGDEEEKMKSKWFCRGVGRGGEERGEKMRRIERAANQPQAQYHYTRYLLQHTATAQGRLSLLILF